jgi:hypothetical protein
MRERIITGVFVLVAVVLAVTALKFEPEMVTPDILSDQGEAFFPEFKDPLACKALEIVAYDEATATARPFKVEFRNRRWVIPSHHSYPADAEQRLAKTAAALMDLRKDMVRSESPAAHSTYGVADPLDSGATSLTGRGKRVTLRDEQGKALAEFILGKAVEGKAGYRYIRVPGQKRTYAVKTEAEPSANFEDWIETDLLKLSAHEIRKITIHNYSINERTAQIENLERITLTKDKDKWSLAGEGTPRKAAVDALVGALDNLRIVDVQPKPLGLSADLRTQQGIQLSMESMMSLRQKGFFFTPTGQLLSNEGEVLVETVNGLVFTLRFGEIASGSAAAVSAANPSTSSPSGGAAATGQERRYVFITARYDPARAAQYAESGAAPDDRGQKLAQELTNRFAGWYYVISGSDFAKLRPRMKDLR